jgi:hypothetical protein
MEAITLVCDVCRQPATATARITVGSRNRLKDLCAAHLAELLKGSRTPRRGRPRTGAAPSANGRSSSAKRSTRGRRKSTKTAARKSSRAKKSSAAAS